MQKPKTTRENLISKMAHLLQFSRKFKIMNPRLIKTILTYAAPFIIGYVVKKLEERQARKSTEKSVTKA
ncbi:hypothetical protein [Chryseobacterium sp. SC28]|uniref:hypothetical protein n=1 Tax=Chryseobacterium sp. SC28 TaxID=2268028 RepID=UPI000F64C47D|nr:hypothetical protein [Chryseobacterium sp. SC28]RRQ45183.1 hypothetical protein DTW91_11760 [Chryseobacterium sp. SC28]